MVMCIDATNWEPRLTDQMQALANKKNQIPLVMLWYFIQIKIDFFTAWHVILIIKKCKNIFIAGVENCEVFFLEKASVGRWP